MSATKAALSTLKLRQLKHWAFLIGMSSTGTKSDLCSLLEHEVKWPMLPTKARRIVSVDMGIRNFAYCTVQTPCVSRKTVTAVSGQESLTVVDWRRLDLLDQTIATEERELPAQSEVPAIAEKTVTESTLFTLPHMSRMAYTLTRGLLLSSPDEILIERQFLPRGPAARVTSEWTLRINKLESMLWACLQTLQHNHDHASSPFPEIHAINPDRVATFWASAKDVSLQPTTDLLQANNKHVDTSFPGLKSSNRKLDKKQKIDIVRSWISGHDDVHVNFEGPAARIAEAFSMDKKRDAETIAGGKIDDLADCLLQAVARVRWEENRRRINAEWQTM